jgi:hypothetical protein
MWHETQLLVLTLHAGAVAVWRPDCPLATWQAKHFES